MDNFGWIPYDKRDDWKDTKPIFQTDEERSVINIAYSEKFALVFAYFRAVLQNEEKSERAFELTKDAVLLNPANYTAWKYRRDLLIHLGKDVQKEMAFCRGVIEENPKNYQVWHHLKLLIEMSGNYEDELAFTDSIFKDDSKNYHAWQHRQWIVKEYGLWSNELDYSKELLLEDLHNNSAWNYRYFVVKHSTDFPSADVVQREIEFSLDFIGKAPHNESAWNYLIGIAEKAEETDRNKIWDFCKSLYQNGNRAAHLLSFMVLCLKEALLRPNADKCEIKLEAVKLLSELEDVDPVRINYWKHLASQFQE